ncbi:DNA polymerase [Macrococcoides canis]|uniref:DNA polymerase n=1 Tax=Macrococcoides canis TaxID=1855823 RepID=UPI0010DE7FEC|nr:DNA polymerase [Macrococcus canis]TDM23087.1 hypothetical protein ETI02_08115 [Macrococcus canis]
MEEHLPSLLNANAALRSLYSLEQAFIHSVLPTLNGGKICIDPQWVHTQNYEYIILQNKVKNSLNNDKYSNFNNTEHEFLQYMKLNGLQVTKDQQQLDALSTLHPVYSMFKEFLKAQQFQKQWVEKLIPYYSKVNNRLEITGNWQSFTSYTGRITSSKLPLTSMPNKMKKWVVPSELDCTIWSIDLSNAELRFLSLYSKDQQLADDLKNGCDIHHIVGTLFKQHMSYKGNEPDHRKAAKTFIFSMLYGAGNARLAEGLKKSGYDIQSSDIIRIKDTIFSRYASLEEYFNSVENEELVRCFFGCIRPLVTMNSSQRRNFALQSSISTTVKILSLIAQALHLKITCIIHDEIWVEVPNNRDSLWITQLDKKFRHTLKTHHPLLPTNGLLKIKKIGGNKNEKI